MSHCLAGLDFNVEIIYNIDVEEVDTMNAKKKKTLREKKGKKRVGTSQIGSSLASLKKTNPKGECYRLQYGNCCID